MTVINVTQEISIGWRGGDWLALEIGMLGKTSEEVIVKWKIRMAKKKKKK